MWKRVEARPCLRTRIEAEDVLDDVAVLLRNAQWPGIGAINIALVVADADQADIEGLAKGSDRAFELQRAMTKRAGGCLLHDTIVTDAQPILACELPDLLD